MALPVQEVVKGVLEHWTVDWNTPRIVQTSLHSFQNNPVYRVSPSKVQRNWDYANESECGGVWGVEECRVWGSVEECGRVWGVRECESVGE